MTCYTLPPPVEEEYKDSSEKAVSLLCTNITKKIDNNENVDRSQLLWFLEHKMIDIKNISNSDSSNIYTKDRINKTKYYIRVVEALLSSD